MQIEIDSIKVPNRVRKDTGDLTSLVDSLRRVGQLNPITVTPDYELIAGFRRYMAARQAGWRSIEANVVSGLDELRRLEMELEENIHRKDFTPEEVLEGWKRLDKLRHPPLYRRVGAAVKRFFLRLCFWRKRPAKTTAVVPVPDTPPPSEESIENLDFQ